MAEMKSKHAFGSEENIDSAIASGMIDAYDILFLNEKKIGWIDKNGDKIILEDKVQVSLVESLPNTGSQDVIYICNGSIYLWDGSGFTNPISDGNVSENMVDSKIETAKNSVLDEAKAYADEKIAAASSDTVVEF